MSKNNNNKKAKNKILKVKEAVLKKNMFNNKRK